MHQPKAPAVKSCWTGTGGGGAWSSGGHPHGEQVAVGQRLAREDVAQDGLHARPVALPQRRVVQGDEHRQPRAHGVDAPAQVLGDLRPAARVMQASCPPVGCPGQGVGRLHRLSRAQVQGGAWLGGRPASSAASSAS